MVANYGAFLLQIGLGIVLAPALLHGLGTTGFGTFTVVGALASYVGIAEMGLGTATVRFVAAAGARKNAQELEAIASTSFALYMAVSTIGTLALGVMAVLLPHLGAVGNINEARAALLALGLAATMNLALNVYPAMLFGSGRSANLTAAGIAGALISGIAQLAIVLTTHSLLATALASAVTSSVFAVVIRHVARRALPQIRVARRNATRNLAKRLMSAGWRNAVIGIAATAAFSTDAVIVSSIVSVAAAGGFGIAARACGIVMNLATRVSDVLVPTYAHYGTVEDSGRVYVMYRESVIAAWLLSLPAAAVAFTAGDGILRLWLGGHVPPAAARVLPVLVAATVLSVPGSCAFRLFSGINRLGFVTVAASLAAAANLGISIWLTFRWGAIGPAVGTLITAVLYDVIAMPLRVCRTVGVPPHRLALDVWWVAIPMAAAIGTGLVARGLGESNLATVERTASTLAIYTAVAWLALGRTRRRKYLALLPMRGRSARVSPG